MSEIAAPTFFLSVLAVAASIRSASVPSALRTSIAPDEPSTGGAGKVIVKGASTQVPPARPGTEKRAPESDAVAGAAGHKASAVNIVVRTAVSVAFTRSSE
ncbi:hypothetical protein GCM10022419_012680 [Nonomuraea rosea]|uniref:Secreted protein n=1 Tax=Nonomuraea rosea TaxID=638574 RepID=A0ABP6VF45_9ACTN